MNEDSYQFELEAALNCMCQDDACGNIYVASYNENKVLELKLLTNWENLRTEDFKDFELVVVDGGNTAGDCWKHIFHPRQQVDVFIDENPIA